MGEVRIPVDDIYSLVAVVEVNGGEGEVRAYSRTITR